MAWINGAPTLLLPVPLQSEIVDIVTLPQSSLLLLASTRSVVVLDSASFLPLAHHNRTTACLASHGKIQTLRVFDVSVNTAENERIKSATFCASTDSTYVLVYQMTINYSNSVYEITDVANPDNVLQNGLPLLHENSKHSLTNIFKSATRSLGLNPETTMINIEHFENGSLDDEARNENLPQVRLVLTKLLKLPLTVETFWTKPNSHSVLFFNAANQIQLLNIKSLNSCSVDLDSYDWFSLTTLLEYNPTHNFFVHVNSNFELSILELTTGESILIQHSLVEKLDLKPDYIIFNPQHDLVLIQLSDALYIYLYRFEPGSLHTFSRIKDLLYGSDFKISECVWSPCGEFLVASGSDSTYRLISKFGLTLFDSATIATEIFPANLEKAILNDLTDFCCASLCLVSANGHLLFVLNKDKTRLYSIGILRSLRGDYDNLILNDTAFISFPLQKRANYFQRVPLLPSFQNVLNKCQLLNGVSTESAFKRPTGKLSIEKNCNQQVSLAYGSYLAISTPVRLGSEAQHALWFQFYNHFTDQMNIVNHFWVSDYLFLVNRYEKDETKVTAKFPEHVVDELMVLSTESSKFGKGGSDFKFDSDLIAWRHTFNNKIMNYELVKSSESVYVLTLLTSDLKIVMMEIKLVSGNSANKHREIKVGKSKISINVCRTIHLSSIRHKFPISNVKKFISVQERHFLFLLYTGDVYLLKNQALGSSSEVVNNIYELKPLGSGIERMEEVAILFSKETIRYVSLFVGSHLIIYELLKLVMEEPDIEGNNGDMETETHDVELHATELRKSVANHFLAKSMDQNRSLRPIIIPASSYMPLQISSSEASIEVLNLEYQIIAKNDHLRIKHKTNRQLVLNYFVGHDLFVANLDVGSINEKYKCFTHYEYCLELLLYENLNEQGKNERLVKLCKLVNESESADAIYVNLLRKIEVHHWADFFNLLQKTPVGLMDHLISSKDVELCYNYLTIYLNHKRESATDDHPDSVPMLNDKERSVILQIIHMLLDLEMWSESYELCRFIKLLEPLNELLQLILQLM